MFGIQSARRQRVLTVKTAWFGKLLFKLILADRVQYLVVFSIRTMHCNGLALMGQVNPSRQRTAISTPLNDRDVSERTINER